ncbi:unnamed protein product [Danaus chrysippus]|uniref:(African queen) hypothetical protein n=1 Tax=Danaus chrysippus TaxID=151541 RepID=A0A8J2VYN8_9NEOP|nr:unnamed protein product [Danaus chrysippus]
MSSRSDWVPIAAGVIVGAGLLALLYSAEQLDKEKQAAAKSPPARSPPARRVQARSSNESPGWFWGWNWNWGWDWGWVSGWAGDGKNWFPILGGATLLALMAFFCTKTWAK